jgi:hypothetical protein
MKMLFALLLLLSFNPIAMAEGDDSPTSYVCTPDFSTGFAKKEGEWRPVRFDISDKKYILRRLNESEKKAWKHFESKKDVSWVWLKSGEKTSWHTCKNEATESGRILCPYEFLDLVVNIKSLTFQIYRKGDYVYWIHPDDPDYEDLTAETYIEIGKCTAKK